ncbi:MAG: hypothetical protein PHQ86_02040 [Dehalococcoidales bacterium]|nr:hypothetical protein [Dehalococcoidales bacterium]
MYQKHSCSGQIYIWLVAASNFNRCIILGGDEGNELIIVGAITINIINKIHKPDIKQLKKKIIFYLLMDSGGIKICAKNS